MTGGAAASRPGGRRSLVAGEDGAVLVVALFASSLLIGLLFYVLGVGRAIRHGETLRDAADAAAFSAAAMSARGMNLMALMNMVKVAVVAVSVALQAVVLASARTIGWIKSSWWRRAVYGWTIPFLVVIQVQAATRYLENQDAYTSTLRAANDVQRALKEDLPRLAAQEAQRVAAAFEGVDGAFFAPLRGLPTEADTQQDFCARVFPHASGITHEAFEGVPLEPVRGYARARAREFNASLCMLSGVTSERLAGDAEMGGEAFAVRAFSHGPPLRSTEEEGVRVAVWRNDEDGGNVARLRSALTRIGLAQAEYYHDGPGEPMWSMNWRARFRRFRSGDGFAAFASACPRHVGTQCATIAQALRAGEDLIVH